jgi:hypothetical protein
MSEIKDYTFRANRDPLREAPTLLEQYGEANIESLLRKYFRHHNPSFKFGSIIEAAATTSSKLVSNHPSS